MKRLRELERGDAGTVEFIYWLPPLIFVLTLITMSAVVRAAQPPVWAAARECARVASAALSAPLGMANGHAVAAETLASSGLAWERAVIAVTHGGVRGGMARCSITYQTGLSQLPMAAWLMQQEIEISSEFESIIEPLQGD